MKLPDPREDGQCCDCYSKAAETNDGRFCKACLRKRIKAENPDHNRRPIREQKGRASRPTQTLGGTTDMTSTDDMDAGWDRR